jgi:hypothetical protein
MALKEIMGTKFLPSPFYFLAMRGVVLFYGIFHHDGCLMTGPKQQGKSIMVSKTISQNKPFLFY